MTLKNNFSAIPIRVLHVVQGLSITGGAQSMIMNIFKNVDKNTVQFDFAVYVNKEENSYTKQVTDMGGRIFYISSPGNVGVKKFISNLLNVINNNGPYDAIHCHNLLHNALISYVGNKAGIKNIISHSHEAPKKISVVQRFKYLIAQKIILRYSNNLVACSKEAGDFLFGKNSKYKILPNAIDIDKYIYSSSEKLSALKKELNLPHNALLIGHIGRFCKTKNQSFLIPLMTKLIKNNINTYLILVGEGDTKDEIERRFQKSGLINNVKFLGAREDIPEILKLIDVIVFPSLYEGLGMVLVEAQAAGKPCVASNNVPKTVDMGLGLIRFLDLNVSIDEWINSIMSFKNIKNISDHKVREQIKLRGYDIHSNIKYIYNLYQNKS